MSTETVVYQGREYREAQMVELWKAIGYQVDYPVWMEFDLGLFAATSSKSVEKPNVKSTCQSTPWLALASLAEQLGGTVTKGE